MTTPTIAEILKCANLQMVAVLMSAYPKPDRQQWARNGNSLVRSLNKHTAATKNRPWHCCGRAWLPLCELLQADALKMVSYLLSMGAFGNVALPVLSLTVRMS